MVQADAQLVAQVRSGDVAAFGVLAERYERTLLAVALASLHDFHKAEDVVQSAFLLAFRRLNTLRDDAKFGAWLIQIARMQAIEATRSCSVALKVSLSPAHDACDAGGTSGWIETEHVLHLMAQLPDQERVLIGLRYFDGHSMAEIAAMLGRPVGTITKQLSRAVVRLRTICEQETSP